MMRNNPGPPKKPINSRNQLFSASNARIDSFLKGKDNGLWKYCCCSAFAKARSPQIYQPIKETLLLNLKNSTPERSTIHTKKALQMA
jgi:hypothetical protein